LKIIPLVKAFDILAARLTSLFWLESLAGSCLVKFLCLQEVIVDVDGRFAFLSNLLSGDRVVFDAAFLRA
jgi:hypothetical protein